MILPPDTSNNLSAIFYARIERDPVLRPLLPKSFRCVIQGFDAWLTDFLGGDREQSERRWWLGLQDGNESHRIGQREREAWLSNMREALDEAGIEEPVRDSLARLFEVSSLHVAAGDSGNAALDQGEIAALWAEQQVIGELVVAVQTLRVKRALELVENPFAVSFLARDRAGLLGLLALMCASGNPALLEFVRRKLLSDPKLVRETHGSGRSLLHGVAETGCVEIVEFLLIRGAAADATDKFLHTPLYCCANACSSPGGPDMIRTLVRAGASVHVRDQHKGYTPLHLAARRGNVGIGEALIECGADLEARDAAGETPLRRAVNCGKAEMAEMLVAHGADIHSIGSRGLTPCQVARSEAMKRALEGGTRTAPTRDSTGCAQETVAGR